MQNFRALGAPPPDPRASSGWGLCPQTPSLRRRLGGPDPQNSPPLRISGYAPARNPYHVTDCHKNLRYDLYVPHLSSKCQVSIFNRFQVT